MSNAWKQYAHAGKKSYSVRDIRISYVVNIPLATMQCCPLGAAGSLLRKHPACSRSGQVIKTPLLSVCCPYRSAKHACLRDTYSTGVLLHDLLLSTNFWTPCIIWAKEVCKRGKELSAWYYASSRHEVSWGWTSLDKTYITCLQATGSQVSGNSGCRQIYGLLALVHIITIWRKARNESCSGDFHHMPEMMSTFLLWLSQIT